MVLCFSGFFFFSTTIFSAGGRPMRSRASSFTAVTARNGFVFFFFAITIWDWPSECNASA